MNARLIPGTLPADYCITSLQAFYELMFSRGSLDVTEIETALGAIISSTEPDPEDRDKLWLRIDADGVFDKAYKYVGGQWVSRHPVAPAPTSYERRIWKGSAADLITYDGGAAGTVGDAAGPMWEEDTDFQARFPLGAGTLPISSTVVGHGDTGGLEKVTLTAAESGLPAHTHEVPWRDNTSGEGSGNNTGTMTNNISSSDRVTSEENDAAAASSAHQNMPPYIGVRFIKRTARKYFTAS